MCKSYRIATWNANGLLRHRQELVLFLEENKIDILLASETHFTEKSYFKINDYIMYDTKHPDGTAHGGTAILIRKNIKHHEEEPYRYNEIQATSVKITDLKGPLTISAVYCPPRHNIKKENFENFFKTLGHRFIAGGDYNCKHTQWGSRLITQRGRELQKAIAVQQLDSISTGEPTYWPTDFNKIPDLLDFLVTKGVSRSHLTIQSCYELSSDHTPVILTINDSIILYTPNISLVNKRTNWNIYREWISENTSVRVPLKTPDDIDEATEYIVESIQNAAWHATPEHNTNNLANKYPMFIRDKITEKRRLRQIWQRTRYPCDKTSYNRASRQLNRFLKNYNCSKLHDHLSNLSPNQDTDYSLFKATKKLKHPCIPVPPIRRDDGTWAKSAVDKTKEFAKYFSQVFEGHSAIHGEELAEIMTTLDSPNQLELPIKYFSTKEIRDTIKKAVPCKKAPGYDHITGQLLKELPRKGIALITALFNSILRVEHFPAQWKVAQILVILKPGKPANEVKSYRPISLLPVLSKLFEKLLLTRIKPFLSTKDIIPSH